MTKARGSFQNRLTQLVCKVMAKQSGTQCMSWYSIMPILQAIGRWTSKRSDIKKKKQEHKYCPSLTASEEFGKTMLYVLSRCYCMGDDGNAGWTRPEDELHLKTVKLLEDTAIVLRWCTSHEISLQVAWFGSVTGLPLNGGACCTALNHPASLQRILGHLGLSKMRELQPCACSGRSRPAPYYRHSCRQELAYSNSQ